jgi:hypothetical protein
VIDDPAHDAARDARTDGRREMAADFPELTSFGTLFGFALALEELAEAHCTAAAGHDDCASRREQLEGAGKRHRKRARELQRLRQERLNEVVLQPITGMQRADYLPAIELPADGNQAIATVAATEESIARFYDDAASVAANVLANLGGKLQKLAAESRSLAAELRP